MPTLPPCDQGQPWVPGQNMAELAGEVRSSPLHGSTASAHLPFQTHLGVFPTVMHGRAVPVSRCKDPPTRRTVLDKPPWSPLLKAP